MPNVANRWKRVKLSLKIMSEDWQNYIKDPRTVCKYGPLCYQKNPEHHKNFKHPPTNKRKGGQNSPAGKRYKPYPRRAKSPTKAKNTTKNKDKDGESDKTEEMPLGDREKSPDLGTGELGNEVSTSNNDESTSSNKEESSTDREQSSCNKESSSITEESTSNKEESSTIKLPDTLSYLDKDDKTLFKELFLVDMPEDFFKFYECLKDEPDFEKFLGSANLELIGPFDLLLGKLPVLDEKDLYLIHWRFFYDPPEFQAVLKKKGKSEYHIGYFRDDPESAPVFLAHTDSAKGCRITPMANNIFGAVYLFLQNEKKSSPFISVACQKVMEKVKKWAETHKYSLEEYDVKKRLVQSVTKTFHGAGIVVPYNKKTELGYRKLVETDANLKKLFAKLEASKSQHEKDKILSEIQPVITYASIAVDECDFGTGLECGIDLFCSGIKELQANAVNTLKVAYMLLRRQAFGKIVEAHMKYRRKGPDMSVLSVGKT